MGDANVRRPVATRFEHGVDFGLLVHKSPFMADDRDPLVLSNYIFELLEVNPGVAGFLIQLHPDDVDAVVLPPLPKAICGMPQRACPHSEDPWGTYVMGCCACHGEMH